MPVSLITQVIWDNSPCSCGQGDNAEKHFFRCAKWDAILPRRPETNTPIISLPFDLHKGKWFDGPMPKMTRKERKRFRDYFRG